MNAENRAGSDLPGAVVVDAAGAGKRIDVFLRDLLPGTSRTVIREEIAAGRVRIDGRPVAKGRSVYEGEEIDISAFRDRRRETIAPDPEGDLRVLHEEETFLVVDKEAGLPALPANADETAALACRVAARYPETAGVGGRFESGLVHRLDTATSGLLVVARDEPTWRLLRAEWKLRRVEKEYLALVRGGVRKPFTVLHPIAHHPKSARRMIVSPSGKSAESRVRPLASGGRRSLVAVSLREGRRHQIRVHLASAGFPVAGDDLYGEGPEKDGVPRLMLHALWLRFRPGEGARRGFLSEPPDDFRAAAEKSVGRDGSRAIDRYREELLRRE